ncbi:hypothetical protein LTS12_028092 [Elasticomyces elasticus]|nr:hypothetical protein LTS12_028092 [Elasticomyces elasticus]
MDVEQKGVEVTSTADHETRPTEDQVGTIFKTTSPSFKETLKIIFSLSAMAVAIPYACSFGSELSINSVLGDYYAENFPVMSQTQTGQWAAMFGLLNIVCRPAGGVLADVVYRYTDSVWSKKILLLFLGVVMGAFQLAIGLSDPKNQATMFGLVAGLAFFLEACNGANFALVPHVHPFANGIVSGTVGGMGNLGGIIFAIIFRYNDSIFFDNDRTIFATFKYVGDDWDGDMKRMRENPKVREWWALTDGMQESPIPGAVSSAEGPGWWKALDEVFHVE